MLFQCGTVNWYIYILIYLWLTYYALKTNKIKEWKVQNDTKLNTLSNAENDVHHIRDLNLTLKLVNVI